MVTSIEAVIELKRPLLELERTLNNGGFFTVTKSTLLENGDYNKGCVTLQVELVSGRH